MLHPAPPRPAERRLLTVEDVATRSAFSRKTIYRAIEAGELDATKPRGRWRITEAAFDAWIASGAHSGLTGIAAAVPAPIAPKRGTLEALRAIEREATA